MNSRIRTLFALLMCFALILQYAISFNTLSVYAEGEDGQPVAETPAEPEPAPEPKPEPKAAPEPEAKPEQEPASAPASAESAETDEPPAGDAADSGSGYDETDNTGKAEGEDVDAASEEETEDDADLVGEEPAADMAEGIEEIPEVTEEEPEADEEKYPEVTLSKTVNGVTVTLHAPEGALPEGAGLTVRSVTRQDVFEAVAERMAEEGREMVDIIAFDVTPHDKDGKEIQPKKSVTVTFSGTGLEAGDIDVFRVSDNAASVTEMGTSVATADRQTFNTDHFTIYASGSSVPGSEDAAGSEAERYFVAFGDTITFTSDKGNGGLWLATRGDGYNFNGNTRRLTNNNDSQREQNVTISHTYGSNIFNMRTEYFYVRLLRQEFTVHFYLQDVRESSPSEIPDSAVTVYNGDTIPAESIPALSDTKDGCKLYSWYTDDTWSVKADTTARITARANKNFYAKYSGEATIHYKKNCSDAVTMPADQTEGIGNMVTIDSTASREGRSLGAWNTKADGSGDSYTPGVPVAMPAEGLTLYAQWNRDTIVITYYLNYNILDFRQWKSAVVTANSRTRLFVEHPERDGYVFRGWATSPLGNPNHYPDTALETGSGNINLYARWGEIRTEDLDIRILTAMGEERIYDGDSHTIKGVAEQEGQTLRDRRYLHVGGYGAGLLRQEIYADVGDIEASGKDAGSYSTPLTAELYRYDVLGLRFSLGQYLEVTNTKLLINPVELVVSTYSGEKLYDPEEALTKGGKARYIDNAKTEHEVTFDPEGTAVPLIKGETLNMRATGEQLDVGQSENGFEYDFGKPDDWGTSESTAKSSNYKFAENPDFGKLTVYLQISFDGNAGDDTVTGMPGSVKAYEPAGAPDAVIPSKTPARNNYTFKGWTKEAGATTADYQPGEMIKALNAGDTDKGILKLYAVWAAAGKKAKAAVDKDDDDDDDTPDTAAAAGATGGGDGTGEDSAEPPVAPAPAETIDDKPIPESLPEGAWALLNVIAGLLTAVAAVTALVRRKDEEDGGEEPSGNNANIAKAAAVVLAAAAAAVLLMTQDFGGMMQYTDKWTALFAALFVGGAAADGMTRKLTK